MDYTREPIIETIITPREGCKLVVRSSKGAGQEEYFVDALEVVSFGNSFFFRSKERPKSFLVPCTDYEVLEVRETRMVLKTVGIEKGAKGGAPKAAEESDAGREAAGKKKTVVGKETKSEPETAPPKLEKKRERKRQYKKRREGRLSERAEREEDSGAEEVTEKAPRKMILPPPDVAERKRETLFGQEEPRTITASTLALTSEWKPLVPPPPSLISETIARYKEDDLFKEAFFDKREDGDLIERGEEEHSRVQELLEEDEVVNSSTHETTASDE